VAAAGSEGLGFCVGFPEAGTEVGLDRSGPPTALFCFCKAAHGLMLPLTEGCNVDHLTRACETKNLVCLLREYFLFWFFRKKKIINRPLKKFILYLDLDNSVICSLKGVRLLDALCVHVDMNTQR
jgi:hypothetical protein